MTTRDSLIKELKSAKGRSCHVVALFIDVRGFSGFAGTAESTNTALYLRTFYLRVLEDFFTAAAFYKLTGDGLMVIYEVDEDPGALTAEVRRHVTKAIELVERFPTITSDDILINVPVPDEVGVGVARGSATALTTSAGIVLDYSGRPLNLAARLMDLARPRGVVFHDMHAKALLGEELGEAFATDEVYVKGIWTAEPNTIHFTQMWVKVDSAAREAPKKSYKFDESEETTLGYLRTCARLYAVPISGTPSDENDVWVHRHYDRPNGAISSERLKAKLEQEPQGLYASFDLQADLRQMAEVDGDLPDSTAVTLTACYTTADA